MKISTTSRGRTSTTVLLKKKVRWPPYVYLCTIAHNFPWLFSIVRLSKGNGSHWILVSIFSPPRRCFPSHVYVYSHKPSFDLPTTLTFLFFSVLPWMDISIYHQKTQLFFLDSFRLFPIFFLLLNHSWIIQKKGYTYYTAPCVCIYSPEGWLPLLYRMDVCIYRWSCQKTSRSLARI